MSTAPSGRRRVQPLSRSGSNESGRLLHPGSSPEYHGIAASLEDLASLLEAHRRVRLAAALNGLAALVEASYTYDTVNEKRWELGDGGRAGNCDTCNDNADRGWIPDEDVFEDSEGGDIDGPPAHPNCTCELSYRERRVRVYD